MTEPSSEERTILQLVRIDDSGDSFYRMRWPGQDLARWRPSWRILSLDASASERFEWALKADLLVLYQSQDLDLLPILSRRKAAGLATLVEYNDNFYDPPASTPVYDAWTSPLVWQAYESFMREADGVLVTGPGLRDLFSTKTSKPIFEIPNQIPDENLPPFEKLWPETLDEIRMGWGGSQGHMPDLFAVLPLIRELIAEFPKLKLYLMGNEAIPRYLDISADRLRFFKWGSMRQYFQFLEGVHLGLIPMLDTPYNRCRSDIKVLEMGSRGVAPVVPDLLAYHRVLSETNFPGYRNFVEMKDFIRELLHDRSKLKARAFQTYEYVKTRRLSCQNQERLEVFSKWMKGKPHSFFSERPKGYHELVGTPDRQPPFRNILEEVQRLFNTRKKEEAFDLLNRELKENPMHPELALAHLKALKALGHPDVHKQSVAYSERFSGDFRFHLMAVTSARSREEKKKLWNALFYILENRVPRHSRSFFQSLVIQSFCQDLQSDAGLLEQAVLLKKIYPRSAALSFELAKAYEFQGKRKEAMLEFAWLLEGVEDFGQNREFLSSVNLMELRTWVESFRDHRLQAPSESP